MVRCVPQRIESVEAEVRRCGGAVVEGSDNVWLQPEWVAPSHKNLRYVGISEER